MEAMEDAALKFITDEEFNFELTCSPAAPEPSNISDEAVESPISEAALVQIFTDAQNVASDIESCRSLVSCYVNQLGSLSDDRASDVFECSPDILISPGKPSTDDSFQLMPGLCGDVKEDSEQCVEDVAVCQPQSHDMMVADLRSRLEHIKSQSRSSTIAKPQNAVSLDNADANAVNEDVIFSDTRMVTDNDVDNDRLLTGPGINQLSVVSDNHVLDEAEYSPDVLTFQGDDGSFQLMPDLCGGVEASDTVRQITTESVEHVKHTSTINNIRRLPSQSRSAVGNAKNVELRSHLECVKSQSTIQKPQNASAENCGPTSVAKPVVRASSLKSQRHLSMIQKPQNAPAESRGAAKPVVRASSLRRIPLFRGSLPVKQRSNADNSKLTPCVDVSASNNVPETTPLSLTPEQCKPTTVQQGTITKDRTRRLERVAGPDVPSTVDKQRTSSTRRSLPVRNSTGGAPSSVATDTVQKSGLMKSRSSIGSAAASTRPGRNLASQARKSIGTAAPPRGTTAPPKAAAAQSRATAMPLESSSGLKRSTMVKQRPTGLLQKPAIKKPMTKLELTKPGCLLSRPATAGKTRSSLAPTGRQAGKGGGPLKAMLPLAAAATRQGDGEVGTCPVGVGKSTGRGLGPATLVSTPVNQERCIRPKRLMHAATPPQANRSNSASSGTPVSVCRSASFLPTPTKRRSYCTSDSSASSSRLASSSSSVDSSVFCPGTPDCGDTPVTRVLADINGLDPNSSPSCLKLRRPRVQHTPVNKENIAESQVPSRWSPMQRPRALSREDEVIQCTKRNATKC